jgi:hypothetical protein
MTGTYTTNKWLYKPAYEEQFNTGGTKYNDAFAVVDGRLSNEVWVGDPKFADNALYTPIQKLINATNQIDTKTRLRIPAGTYSVTSDLVIDSDLIILAPEPGAIFQITGSGKLTCCLECGLWQCFDDQTAGLNGVVLKNISTVYPEWFGAAGDGETDDTGALQKSFNISDSVIILTRIYKITSGLTRSGYPIVMHSNSNIIPSGSGYTILTITDTAIHTPDRWNIIINNYGDTDLDLNGVIWNNPIGQVIDFIRVYGLAGFGLNIEYCWDCIFNKISIEYCGNSTYYAFSLSDGTDSCNNSIFHQIQVELSTEKSLFIDDMTTNCNFGVIHSERAEAKIGGIITWYIGGYNNTFNSSRFNTLDDYGILDIQSSQTIFNSTRVEGKVTVRLTSTAYYGSNVYSNPCLTLNNWDCLEDTIVIIGYTFYCWGRFSINNSLFSGLLQVKTHLSPIKVSHCSINDLQMFILDTVEPHETNNNVFEFCNIRNISECDNVISALYLKNCTVETIENGKPAGYTKFDNCPYIGSGSSETVIWNTSMSLYGGEAYNTKFIGTISGSYPIDKVTLSHVLITGDLLDDGADHKFLIDHSVVEGTVSNSFIKAPVMWDAVRGHFHQNLIPEVVGISGSQYIINGWSCTESGSGSSGTWVPLQILTGT